MIFPAIIFIPKNNFAFLDALTRIAELKIEQLFNVIGINL